MKITISNCNNIDSGVIEIAEHKLNIKYAINGTGKSTIARAIKLHSETKGGGKADLSELRPFKHLASKDGNPDISGIDSINSIKIFDENYINEFIFQPDELIKGSFDIFMRDDEFEKGTNEINDLVLVIQENLSKEADIANLIGDLSEISDSFGKQTKTGIHGSSGIAKALKDGNKVANIPDGLEGYKTFIQGESNFKWVKWQMDGKGYMELSDNCPYCTNDIQEKKSAIRKIGEVYDHKSVENLNKIVSVFTRLDRYFSSETRDVIKSFVANIDGYKDEQAAVLVEIKGQIDRLREKFIKAQNIGFTSLKDVDKVIDGLKSHKIALDAYNHLKSDDTSKKVKIVNDAIDDMLSKASELQGKINKHKKKIEQLIKENGDYINAFMKNAGYRYEAVLTPDANGQHKLKLIHADVKNEIASPKSKLSYGERNAFALVLFMFDVVKAQSDLVILDDPISSFDKNKKYAIIEMLFRGERSLRDKTVLMLTHDLDPIIDIVYHHSDRFVKPVATFIENNRGVVSEKEIKRNNIVNFYEINTQNSQLSSDVSKLVYLRRNYEATNSKGMEYQLISSILHKKNPSVKSGEMERPMSDPEIYEASKSIAQLIPGFDLAAVTACISDDKKMKNLYFQTTSNYEKLHLYRIINQGKPVEESNVIKKFINESFHIENDYIYQLNPAHYQTVPVYIIDECDKIVNQI